MEAGTADGDAINGSAACVLPWCSGEYLSDSVWWTTDLCVSVNASKNFRNSSTIEER